MPDSIGSHDVLPDRMLYKHIYSTGLRVRANGGRGVAGDAELIVWSFVSHDRGNENPETAGNKVGQG